MLFADITNEERDRGIMIYVQWEMPYTSQYRNVYFNYTGTASINFNHWGFLTSERPFWSLDITFTVHVQCSFLFNNCLFFILFFFPFEEEWLDCAASCLAVVVVSLHWAMLIYISCTDIVALNEMVLLQVRSLKLNSVKNF